MFCLETTRFSTATLPPSRNNINVEPECRDMEPQEYIISCVEGIICFGFIIFVFCPCQPICPSDCMVVPAAPLAAKLPAAPLALK